MKPYNHSWINSILVWVAVLCVGGIAIWYGYTVLFDWFLVAAVFLIGGMFIRILDVLDHLEDKLDEIKKTN